MEKPQNPHTPDVPPLEDPPLPDSYEPISDENPGKTEDR